VSAAARTELLTLAGVAGACALGGLLRYWVGGLVDRGIGETFPWGTLVVNLVGSVAIGLFAAVTGPDGRLLVSPVARQSVAIGLLGGFTTFSSFSIQTLALAQGGEWARALANVLLSVVLCLLGVWAGWQAGIAWSK
jgi:CrcB protein